MIVWLILKHTKHSYYKGPGILPGFCFYTTASNGLIFPKSFILVSLEQIWREFQANINYFVS
ncbi:hypothetical protein CLV32_1231 [Pedobacter duraquae]|uniref:Uncharacterized protein n=1 Tax=Pedobacter duraquae TaxID=425511 RepID=A0A4R6ISI5_9SPHI|nr:hypothetical protein CLV32_1231 [Pedobacter duraquae]